MPFAHNLLEVGPSDQILFRNHRLRREAKLESRQEHSGAADLRPVLLQEQLLVLEPLRDVGQDAQQEATCVKRVRHSMSMGTEYGLP